MNKIRVLLADDHSLFREGMISILHGQPDFDVVGEAADGLEVVVMARKLVPDLILMDIGMPGCDGVEATRQIKQELPNTVVVILTVRDEDEKLFEAIRSGAQGYLLKSIRARELLAMLRGAVRGEAAITPALGGRILEEFRRLGGDTEERILPATDDPPHLTAREQQVLKLVAQGATDQEIAGELVLSIHTVKTHMRNILAKLQLGHRYDAADYALREGLIDPNDDRPTST
jgi:DNA-binding NarL/FixJ family response regulator